MHVTAVADAIVLVIGYVIDNVKVKYLTCASCTFHFSCDVSDV